MMLSKAVRTLSKRREWLDAHIKQDHFMHGAYSAERAALDIAINLMILEMRKRHSEASKPPGERRESFNSVTNMFES